MALVIVTQQCYLLCEAINYIVINEINDTNYNEWSPRTPKQKKQANRIKFQKQYMDERKPYHIIIDFLPLGAPPQPGNSMTRKDDGTATVTVTVQGLKPCIDLFQDMVKQIRDQTPDQLHLNKLVEEFLLGYKDDNGTISKN